MPEYERMVGSRAQVWHGTAHHTSGGLTKGDLVYDEETQRIKSKKKVALAKKQKFLVNWLEENGHEMKKGEFALIPKKSKKRSSRTKKRSPRTSRKSSSSKK